MHDKTEALGLVLIDPAEFQTKLGLKSESSFYEMARKDPRFPKPIRRGKRWAKYALHEADAYIRALLSDRDKVAA